MNNLSQKLTKENIADKSATEEREFTSNSLMEEFVPLLKDYFESKIEFKPNGLFMYFHNGQKFRLVIDNVSDK